MKQIKLYVTAKREHAKKILASVPDGFHLNARWVHMAGDNIIRPVTHWLRENFDDAIASHCVVLYVEPGDDMNISLLEIGNAMGYGKKIFLASNYVPSDEELMNGYLPHKKLKNWIGFDDVKYTGTLGQTYKAIKESIWARRIIENDGRIS